MQNFIAQNSTNLGSPLNGIGPLGDTGSGGLVAIQNFNKVISIAVGLMTIIAVVWFFFVFITGAYGIISSGGEKGAYENAQKKIRTGLIGLIMVIVAVFVVDFIGFIFGLDLILDPAALFVIISPK